MSTTEGLLPLVRGTNASDVMVSYGAEDVAFKSVRTSAVTTARVDMSAPVVTIGARAGATGAGAAANNNKILRMYENAIAWVLDPDYPAKIIDVESDWATEVVVSLRPPKDNEGTLFIAYYGANDELLKVVFEDADDVEKTVTDAVPSGTVKITAMIWSGPGGMMPLCKAFPLEKP